MKKYQTKPKFVKACQYDGTEESIAKIRKKDIWFNGIKLEKGCWIVKDFDAKEDYMYVVMTNDQFVNKYITIRDIGI